MPLVTMSSSLKVDGLSFDLGNLCLDDSSQAEPVGPEHSQRPTGVSCDSLPQFTSYPSVDELPACLDVDDIFEKLRANKMLRSGTPAGSRGRRYRTERLLPVSRRTPSTERFQQGQVDDSGTTSASDSGGASSQRTMVEVTPGEFVPLRGSLETWEAVVDGAVKVTSCSCCHLQLTCVRDADLVMCPGCGVISSVANGPKGGGLGLGMSVEQATLELQRRGLHVPLYR